MYEDSGYSFPGVKQSRDENLKIASFRALIGGGVILGAGIVACLLRPSYSRQESELERIDNRLRDYGVSVSVAIWIAPDPAQHPPSAGLTVLGTM